MIRVNQIKLSFNQNTKALRKKVCKLFKLKDEDILQLKIVKRSIDARKKPDIFYLYSVDVLLRNEKEHCKHLPANCQISEDVIYDPIYINKREMNTRPIIIGAGPAGLFCAYLLALNGFAPILLERGQSVREREKTVLDFWQNGVLKKNSNVQFGEGGAGTFSDGKLNTLIKDKTGKNRFVLETFVKFGAPEHILYEAKPHIGTDILIKVVENMREELIILGTEVCFDTQVTDLLVEDDKVIGVGTEDGRQFFSDAVILAIGHSARDTFSMLYERNVLMLPKSFAVGFRVEHPRKFINYSQYGLEESEFLPTANYKLTAQTENNRGVYSFCMCPGGYVVNASSEEGRLAVNGMSYSDRLGDNSNSAVIVTVTPDDFDDQDPLAGVRFQKKIEEKAYQIGKGCVPVEAFSDFENAVLGHKTEKEGVLKQKYPDYHPAIKGNYLLDAPVHDILPKELNEAFVDGIHQFGRKIKGYDDPDMLISGVESRTSSPVRISRDEDGQSVTHKGLYPCGEGAGYAGGIMSAAMDGLTIAEKIIL